MELKANALEQFVSGTTLTIAQIDHLTSKVTGKPTSKSKDKPTAITRYAAALFERFGAKNAETAMKETLIDAAGPEVAEGKLQALIDDVDGAAPAPDEANGKKRGGRASEFKGKQLFPAKEQNPRRPGTHGFKSYKIILEHPGISYEAYVAAGGRNNDLRWDVDRGHVRVQ